MHVFFNKRLLLLQQMGQKIRFLLHIYPSYFAFSYPVLLKSALNTRQLQIRSKCFDFSYEEMSKSGGDRYALKLARNEGETDRFFRWEREQKTRRGEIPNFSNQHHNCLMDRGMSRHAGLIKASFCEKSPSPAPLRSFLKKPIKSQYFFNTKNNPI